MLHRPVLSAAVMALNFRRSWHACPAPTIAALSRFRNLRSDAVLEAIAKASEERTPNVALYNYPSFSGAISALFAYLFHRHLNVPCLILPFSSVVPLRVEELAFEGLKKCYFLDFIGPKGFALELSRRNACEVICFDHRKSVLSAMPSAEDRCGKLTFHVDLEKSSSKAAYEYFSNELERVILSMDENGVGASGLLNPEDLDRVGSFLKYIEDGDLRQWRLPDIQAFNIGINEWRSKINCIANPHMFEQLLKISSEELIDCGNYFISSRQDAARNVLLKVFKLRLGRGLYGECLGTRVDGNSDLSNEIGKELSLRSAAAGLRPIGAVIYMQRNNLKMCLRSTDCATDTSEVAKAYGGGGSKSSSSFIIRMDEYNQWLSVNSAA